MHLSDEEIRPVAQKERERLDRLGIKNIPDDVVWKVAIEKIIKKREWDKKLQKWRKERE